MYKLSLIDKLSIIFVIIGSLNWGTIGLLDFNFVNSIFGNIPLIERIVYILVGISGINVLLFILKSKKSK